METSRDTRSRDRAERTQARRARWPRWLAVAGLLVLSLLIVVRIVLDPLASWATRKALRDARGIDGAFADVSVGLFPPRYEITRLKVVNAAREDWDEPWVFAEQVRATLDGSALLRGKLRVTAEVRGPKLRVPGGPVAQVEPDASDKPLGEVLEALPPVSLTRLEVHDAEVLAKVPARPEEDRAKARRDAGGQREVARIWVHDVDVVVENVTTHAALADGQPVNVSMAGKIERSGQIQGFGTIDLFSEKPRFAGRFEMRELALTRLFDLLAPRTGMQASQGTLDLFVQVKAADGRIEGGIKPVLKNVEVEQAEEGWTNALKAWLVDQGIDLASDRVPGRNAVATTIPIRGSLERPDLQVWPAVLGVVRNAFVSALASGYFNVPPDVAKEDQGPLEQTVDAVTGQDPPKAQPKAK